MKSAVFFIGAARVDGPEKTACLMKALIDKSQVLDAVSKGDKVAVKAHFGEDGNTGYARPEYAAAVCAAVLRKGAGPYLTDTNTLYRGRRRNSKDHLELAAEHGFTRKTLGADVVIPDDLDIKQVAEVPTHGSILKSAYIARCFVDADAIIALSHFKGHILTGFGGAIKNIAMGCAVPKGKMAQHNDAMPHFRPDACTGCGRCVSVCPVKAIVIRDGKADLDKIKCIGCATCVGACPSFAMFIDFSAGSAVQKKMAEYAAAVLKPKRGKCAFINVAVRINKECDCWAGENPQIGPDIGVFASLDPVAIDKASFDVTVKKCGCDIFKAAHPDNNCMIQLEHAQKIGLGSLDYELKEC